MCALFYKYAQIMLDLSKHVISPDLIVFSHFWPPLPDGPLDLWATVKYTWLKAEHVLSVMPVSNAK